MRTQTWLKGHKIQGESNSGVSQTQPDMTMSLAELLRRHAQGREIPMFEATYEGDDYFPDPRTLDLADVHEMATRNAEHIQSLQSSLKAKSGAEPAGHSRAVATESDAIGRMGEAEGEAGEAPSPSRTKPDERNG